MKSAMLLRIQFHAKASSCLYSFLSHGKQNERVTVMCVKSFNHRSVPLFWIDGETADDQITQDDTRDKTSKVVLDEKINLLWINER